MFPAVCISRAISKPIEGNFYLGSDEHLHFFADFCVRIDGVGNLHKGVAGFGGGRNRKTGEGEGRHFRFADVHTEISVPFYA